MIVEFILEGREPGKLAKESLIVRTEGSHHLNGPLYFEHS
jgi:hypothetical protein